MTRHPGKGGYALDFSSPLVHVATRLAEAGAAGVTRGELNATYKHPIAGDLHRVRLHELTPKATDRHAELWLVERAISELGDQVALADGRLRLSVPANELHDREGNPVPLQRADPHRQFGNPFNPLTNSGVLARDMRAPSGRDDTTELEESMRAFGWLPELPAIADERGVILAGHRRLKVAEKLGIEPRIVKPGEVSVPLPEYGDDDLGTVKRAIVGYASNLGQKPLTAADRRFIAKRMYEVDNLTQAEIAERLQTDQATISRDLGIMQVHKSSGRGRPPKSRPSKTEQRDMTVAVRLNRGDPPAEVARDVGLEVKQLAHARQSGTEKIVQSQGGLDRLVAGSTPHCPTCTCQNR